MDFVKAMFLLVTLPNIWETFKKTLSSSTSLDGLTSANVEASLLIKEVNIKNSHKGKEEALVVRGRQPKGKKEKRVQSRSKSRSGHDRQSNYDIECYHWGKTGHMKRECSKWKQEKGKGKTSDSKDKKKGVKIEEVKVMHNSEDGDGDKTSGDIFYTSFDPVFLTTEDGHAMSD